MRLYYRNIHAASANEFIPEISFERGSSLLARMDAVREKGISSGSFVFFEGRRHFVERVDKKTFYLIFRGVGGRYCPIECEVE